MIDVMGVKTSCTGVVAFELCVACVRTISEWQHHIGIVVVELRCVRANASIATLQRYHRS
jgi:hypothetical protein